MFMLSFSSQIPLIVQVMMKTVPWDAEMFQSVKRKNQRTWRKPLRSARKKKAHLERVLKEYAALGDERRPLFLTAAHESYLRLLARLLLFSFLPIMKIISVPSFWCEDSLTHSTLDCDTSQVQVASFFLAAELWELVLIVWKGFFFHRAE